MISVPSILLEQYNSVGILLESPTGNMHASKKIQISFGLTIIRLLEPQVDILVSSQGACSQAILTAGGAAMRKRVTTPNIGQITVTPGFALPCSHVIHTNCSPWNDGISEVVSF